MTNLSNNSWIIQSNSFDDTALIAAINGISFDDTALIAAINGITFNDAGIITAINSISFDDTALVTAINSISFDDTALIDAINNITFDDTDILNEIGVQNNLLELLLNKVTLVQINHNCLYDGQKAIIKYFSDDTIEYSTDGASWNVADESKIECPCCNSEPTPEKRDYCPLLNVGNDPNRLYYRNDGTDLWFYNWGYGLYDEIRALAGLQAGTLQHTVTLHYNGINGSTTAFNGINYNPDTSGPRAYVFDPVGSGLNSVGYVGVFTFDFDDGSGEIHQITLRYEYELTSVQNLSNTNWEFIEITDYTCTDITFQSN